MCLAVYLATDIPLTPIPWNEAAPAFYLKPVPDSEAVRRQFSLPNVYYAGSHEGCSCGFRKEWEEGESLALHQANYVALGRALRDVLVRGGRAELFSCWEGDQETAPEETGSVTPAEIEDPSFQLGELQLLRIQALPAQ